MQLQVESDGRRARAGFFLTPLSALVVWLSPLPLTAVQHRLLAIVCAVIVAWVTEVVPIPVTALLIAPLMVASGITDAQTAFAPYADPLLFLFYGSFFMAAAMSRHRLDRRIAYAVVSHRLIAGSAGRSRAALMAAGMLLSMWISNTASTAMLVPIFLGTLPVEDEAGPDQNATTTGSLLSVAYGCSLGGMGTLVGTPPNLIAVGMLTKAGHPLGFVDWLLIGVPTACVLTWATYLIAARLFPLTKGGGSTHLVARDFGVWSRGERVTAFAFGLAICGWMTPGVLKALGHPLGATLSKALPAGGVAMLASSLLFVCRDEARQPVLPWQKARDVDWGIILFFGGGISLGKQMFDTGLADELGKGFIQATGVSDLWTLTGLALAFTVFLTEVCSNTATASMLSPLVIGVAHELGVSPIAPTLGVALGASCAFMLPVATGPNAIVFGTGRIALPSMVRAGFWLNLVSIGLVFGLLRVLLPAYGWLE